VFHLSQIAVGAAVYNRVGRSARLCRLQISGLLNAGINEYESLCKQALVWDRFPNKALASITDIWDGGHPVYFENQENMNRFVILYERTVVLTGNANAAGTMTSGMSADIGFDVDLPGLTTFSTTADTTGVIGNTISGALLYCCRGTCTGANVANVAPTAYTCARLWFYD